MGHTWDAYGTHMGRIGRMGHIWNAHGTDMGHIWDTFFPAMNRRRRRVRVKVRRRLRAEV